jgi:hypothetical protein
MPMCLVPARGSAAASSAGPGPSSAAAAAMAQAQRTARPTHSSSPRASRPDAGADSRARKPSEPAQPLHTPATQAPASAGSAGPQAPKQVTAVPVHPKQRRQSVMEVAAREMERERRRPQRSAQEADGTAAVQGRKDFVRLPDGRQIILVAAKSSAATSGGAMSRALGTEKCAVVSRRLAAVLPPASMPAKHTPVTPLPPSCHCIAQRLPQLHVHTLKLRSRAALRAPLSVTRLSRLALLRRCTLWAEGGPW